MIPLRCLSLLGLLVLCGADQSRLADFHFSISSDPSGARPTLYWAVRYEYPDGKTLKKDRSTNDQLPQDYRVAQASEIHLRIDKDTTHTITAVVRRGSKDGRVLADVQMGPNQVTKSIIVDVDD